MREKITYIAEIFDVKFSNKKKFFTNSEGKKTKIHREKVYSNRRNKLFCKCGGSIEFFLQSRRRSLTRKEFKEKSNELKRNSNAPFVIEAPDEFSNYEIYSYGTFFNEFEPVICPECKVSYKNHSQVEFLSTSSTFGSNISYVRFRTFENEKTISLCCYATKIIVNPQNKNLIFKDVKSSISLNKKWLFFTKIYAQNNSNKNIIRRCGLQYISSSVKEVVGIFSEIQLKRMESGTLDREEVEKELLSSMDEFCNKLMSFINQKDISRILAILDKVFLDTLGDSVKLSDRVRKKYDFLIKYKIPTILAVSIYPPLATLFLTKGIDFTLEILNARFIPRTSILRKEMPTSPIKILESFVRLKIITDSKLRLREEKQNARIAKGIPVKKTFYKYDESIPSKISKDNERLRFIKISKKTFSEMKKPESLELFVMLVIQDFMSLENATFFINKYGIDFCNNLFFTTNFFGFINGIEGVSDDRKKKRIIEHLIKINTKDGIMNTRTVSLYLDTYRIINLLERDLREVFEAKNHEDISRMHDRLTKEYSLVKDEILNRRVLESMKKHKYMSCEIKGVSFETLCSVLELNKEASEMRHCVGTYANMVGDGSFAIFRVTDLVDGTRATMSIGIKDENFSFDQLKSFGNSAATDKIKQSVLIFIKNNKVTTKEYMFSSGSDLHNAFSKKNEQSYA